MAFYSIKKSNYVEDDIVFGKSRIGGWLSRANVKGRIKDVNMRSLNGRVDGLMIFDHPLSKEEVLDIYNQTKPKTKK